MALRDFEFTGSQELKQQAAQAVQRMRESGDLNQQLAANSQQVITAIFGSPEIRKAQATEKALAEVFSEAKQNDGESDIDFAIRQNNLVRERLANIDPQVAIQANDRIIQLNSEKLEQRALKNRIETGEFELQNALDTAMEAKKPVIFKTDITTGITTAVADLDPDASQEEINAELARWQEANPNATYQVGSGLDKRKLEEVDTSKTGGVVKSKLGEWEDQLVDTAVLFKNGTHFVKQLQEAPQSLTRGSKQLAEGGSMINTIRRVAGAFVRDDIIAEEDSYKVEDIMAREGYLETMEDLGIESSVSRGLVLNMAYTLAKTLDPGGRLSDQDVEMAIQMLTGNGDPNALKKLLRARFEEAGFKADQHRTRAMNGGLNGQYGLDKFKAYEEQSALFWDALAEFEAIIDEGGLAQRHRETFGGTIVRGGSDSGETNDELQAKRDRLRARLGGG